LKAKAGIAQCRSAAC